MRIRWMLGLSAALLVSGAASLTEAQEGTTRGGVDSLALQDAADASRKAELAHAILLARQAAAGRDMRASWPLLKSRLMALPLDRLESFYQAGGLGNIEAAFDEPVTNSLGSSAADLVFTPVPPCRIVDTRSSAGGLIVAGVDQSFLVRSAGGFAAQGGSATDCGIPATATSVEMNFVAVGPAGAGDLRVFPVGGTLPSASVLNYASLPGLNIANGIAQPVCNPATSTCTKDLTIHADVSNTHVVIDVVGYFNKVDTTAASGQILSGQVAVSYVANSGGFVVWGAPFPVFTPVGTPVPTVEYTTTTTANCPGPGQSLIAGRVCMYGRNINGVTSVTTGGGNTTPTIRYGFSVDIFFTAAANGWFLGNWAYRVP